jgi:exonuclease SbcD
MKILHTSDWHLGQTLVSNSREKEHRKFFDWLLETIKIEEIDCLIVAGDIFDNATPPSYAQKLYFDFLGKLKSTCCRNAFILGGNHDSPAVLNAPASFLEHLNVFAMGAIPESAEDQVFVVKKLNGEPGAIFCAIPFLRDRDVRKSIAGETYDEKNTRLLAGIRNHFQNVLEIAQNIANELGKPDLPIIGSGHLFAAGSQVSESTRDIYVGNLFKFSGSDFPDRFDYIALGHIHIPQLVGKRNKVRYSGAPIPMSFDEGKQIKQVVVFDTLNKENIRTINIPCFQHLALLKGSFEEIGEQLSEVVDGLKTDTAWLEIQVQEDREIPRLNERVSELVENLPVEVLVLRHLKSSVDMGLRNAKSKKLSEFTPTEVFEKRLELETAMTDPEKEEMRLAFSEIVENLDISKEELQ